MLHICSDFFNFHGDNYLSFNFVGPWAVMLGMISIVKF